MIHENMHAILLRIDTGVGVARIQNIFLEPQVAM